MTTISLKINPAVNNEAAVKELISAINFANNNPGEDTINLWADGTYTLNNIDNSNVFLYGNNGLPVITDSLTINGNNATIQRSLDAPNFRIFLVVESHLSLNNFTIKNGVANSGWLVTGKVGGGILNYKGTINLNNSTLSNNQSKEGGGGIFSYAGTVNLSNSTLSNNSSEKEGGGIFNNGGTFTVTNSTISANSAKGNGGGIVNTNGKDILGNGEELEGNITIINSTIISNVADSDNDGNGNGGGVVIKHDNGIIQNTIIAGNYDNSIMGEINPDVAGVFLSNGNNIIGDATGSTGFNKTTDFTFTSLGNINITNVLNPTLTNNGGFTLTHALIPDSPAKDAGNNAFVTENFDQRGIGFSRVIGNKVDIGAYEDQTLPDLTPPTAKLNVVNLTTLQTIPHSFNITYQDNKAVDKNTLNDNNVLVISPKKLPLHPKLAGIKPDNIGGFVATYEINSLDGVWDSTDNGIYTINLQPNAVSDTSNNFINSVFLGSFKIAINDSKIDNQLTPVLTNLVDNTETNNPETKNLPSDLTPPPDNYTNSTYLIDNSLATNFNLDNSKNNNPETNNLPSDLTPPSNSYTNTTYLIDNLPTTNFNLDNSENNKSETNNLPPKEIIDQNNNPPNLTNLPNLAENLDINNISKTTNDSDSTQIIEKINSSNIPTSEITSNSSNPASNSPAQIPSTISEVISQANLTDSQKATVNTALNKLPADTLQNVNAQQISDLANQAKNLHFYNNNINQEQVADLVNEISSIAPELNIDESTVNQIISKYNINLSDVTASNEAILFAQQIYFGGTANNLNIILGSEECNCPFCKQQISFDAAIPQWQTFQLGSEDDDSLTGTPSNDSLKSLGGKDIICGLAGDDLIIGGNSSKKAPDNQTECDQLFGNEGNDYIYGNEGNDTICGGQDNDIIFAGRDDDILWGDLGNDTLIGDLGNDTIYGGTSTIKLSETAEQDWIFAGFGDDLIFGNEGEDTICAGEDNDTVNGGKNNDFICGDKGNDFLAGDLGNDSIYGDEGNDTLLGGNSSKISSNYPDDDLLCGGLGNDLIYGNEGQDVVKADEGDDTIYGGKGNDILSGDAGNDWLFGNKDNDILSGGLGTDFFVLLPSNGNDTILDFQAGIDALVLGGGLNFEQLIISTSQNSTFISISSTSEILATLTGISVNAITEKIFSNR